MSLSTIHTILTSHQSKLGDGFDMYHNHCCRVYTYAVVLSNANEDEQQQLAIASAFHDIGIWTHGTFDYLGPSVSLAMQYLADNKLLHWNTSVYEIIMNHHKLSRYNSNHLAEAFRKADLVDLSLNLFTFGISQDQLKEANAQYPALGFHWFIAKQILRNIVTHPLNPLPIVRW
ncbi:MAG TPA: HD domain-containing protein [Chitinophagales bacterium]|nr:HD domain-containing protein [Chitinophagales bacterium]